MNAEVATNYRPQTTDRVGERGNQKLCPYKPIKNPKLTKTFMINAKYYAVSTKRISKYPMACVLSWKGAAGWTIHL